MVWTKILLVWIRDENISTGISGWKIVLMILSYPQCRNTEVQNEIYMITNFLFNMNVLVSRFLTENGDESWTWYYVLSFFGVVVWDQSVVEDQTGCKILWKKDERTNRRNFVIFCAYLKFLHEMKRYFHYSDNFSRGVKRYEWLCKGREVFGWRLFRIHTWFLSRKIETGYKEFLHYQVEAILWEILDVRIFLQALWLKFYKKILRNWHQSNKIFSVIDDSVCKYCTPTALVTEKSGNISNIDIFMSLWKYWSSVGCNLHRKVRVSTHIRII